MSPYLQALRTLHQRHETALASPGQRLPALQLSVALAAIAAVIFAGYGYHGGFVSLNALAVLFTPEQLQLVTACGDSLVALLVLPLLARRHPQVLWLAIIAAVIATLISHAIKPAFDALRPAAVLQAGSFHLIGPAYHHGSFPSGHSVTAFVTAGVLAWSLRRAWIRTALLALATTIAISRVLVGAHWPVDALAGAVVGLLSLPPAAMLAERWRFGLRFWPHHLLVAVLVVACLAALRLHAPYPAATPWMHLAALSALACLIRDYLITPLFFTEIDGDTAHLPSALAPSMTAPAKQVLVTGGAGFIGFHTCLRLLKQGFQVTALDNLNDYYDPALKRDRLAQLANWPDFRFHLIDLADRERMRRLAETASFDAVIHLGAQAGVRHSLEAPHDYIDSNVHGTLNVLELCRSQPGTRLIYASSSSVYGESSRQPFNHQDRCDTPVSLYAATKRSAELLCESYAALYGIWSIGLRFFTVYGPWGRPDMAYFKFSEAILAGRPIDLYNGGNMLRDFTYIDDVVDAIVRVLHHQQVAATPVHPHAVYNIGNDRPEPLERLVRLLETGLGRTAQIRKLPMQPGDVAATWADIRDTRRDFGWQPRTGLDEGLARFTTWLLAYRHDVRAELPAPLPAAVTG